MSDSFDEIRRMYGDSYRVHGVSPSSLLTPKGRNELRFAAVDPFVTRPGTRILDYGCGLGYLYEYLRDSGRDVEYVGVDITPEFIASCRERLPGAEFRQIAPDETLTGDYDVVFSSGVFNIRTHSEPAESKDYAYRRIEGLFAMADTALVCDFLSAYVDFQQPDSQHFSPQEISDFCFSRLGRRFVIRHDILPYEMTLLAWKDSAIKRPENVYMVNA